MASTIVTKNSSTASAVPVSGDLTQGELAVNVTDKKLYTKNASGTVVELGTTPTSLTTGAISGTTLAASGAVTFSGGTANGVAYLNGSKVVTTGSALTFDGTNGATTGNWTAGNLLSTAGGYLRVNRSDNATYNEIKYVTSGDLFYFNQANGGAYQFNITGTEQMRLTSTGLGIGTSSPSYKLDVQTAAGRFQVRDLGGSSLKLINSTTGGNIGIDSAGGITLIYANGTETARFDASGNLGLGVTPSAWGSFKALQIGGGTYNGIASSNSYLLSSANAYFDGSAFKYISSAAASTYTQNGGAHYWNIATSGTAGNAITFTQAMTLDASGNLSVGTTNNQARVNIGFGYSGSTATSLGDVSKSHLHLGYPGFNDQYCQITFGYDSTNAAAAIGYTSTTATGNTKGALVFATRDVTTSTLPTERARIDSSGALLVGVTSSSGRRLFVSGTPTATTYVATLENTTGTTANPFGLQIYYTGTTPNGAGNQFLECLDSTATRFRVYSNGGLANYSANNVNLSDRREKTNFAPAGDYLSKICSIPVQTFNYIDQNLEEDAGLTLGVVAQDVQAVAPELVKESNWGTEEDPKMRLSIYQTDLQYALMKCIQEQQAIIEQLKADVAALKGN